MGLFGLWAQAFAQELPKGFNLGRGIRVAGWAVWGDRAGAGEGGGGERAKEQLGGDQDGENLGGDRGGDFVGLHESRINFAGEVGRKTGR